MKIFLWTSMRFDRYSGSSMINAMKNNRPSMAVVGSSMMDLTCYADSLPAAGETSFGKSFTTGFGGKGANQAIMASRCGSKVYMIGSVGKDLFGDSILQNFKSAGIDVSFTNNSDIPTGVAHIWVDSTGENRIIIVPGANIDIGADGAAAAIANIPDLRIVIAQCEIRQEVTISAFESAKQRGCLTLLNPAPYQPLSHELLAATDWIIVNEVEFSQIHPLHLAPSTDAIISTFRPGKPAVVTLGADGAAIVDALGSVQRVAVPQVIPIDTTGAGDCFIGAFASALIQDFAPLRALTFGALVASQSVLRHGAQSSYPTSDEITQILDRIGA
jgi:ribokinase